MTKQCCDYMWYKNEKFVLIDCEKDKDIINSADFGLKNFSAMTCCYRGYTAEYFIEDNFLYGKKTVEDYTEITDSSININFKVSPKMKMNYTGSAIIAINDSEKYCGADFFENFLFFDRAYELYFIDGELCELTDLSPAIQEYKELKDSLIHTKNYYEILFEKSREIAVKHLQYEYGINYK
ncbi:MAG: hypothetical protein K2K16_08235 [Ruminococcus sp.]|nr:hypothetical protein [Ruminococcus sp.]